MHRITVVTSIFRVGGEEASVCMKTKKETRTTAYIVNLHVPRHTHNPKKTRIDFLMCENKKGASPICHRICRMKMVCNIIYLY